MSKYWSELTRNVEPYVPGDQPRDKDYIKLNTNENPYPPAPGVIEAIKNSADDGLRLYPDPLCRELRQKVAEYYGINEEEVFIGNGSDEILAFSFMAFFDKNDYILFPDISYSFYPVYANVFNINYKTIALNEDFSLPFAKFSQPNGGLIFPNPNAPTGKYLSTEKIEIILQENKENVVIVDEAYIDFGGESVVSLLKEYPNLLVTQTFSKSRALAGLRVGFALGQKHLIEGLNRIKNSFNSYTIDRGAIAGAKAAIEEEEYFQEITEKIIATREYTAKELRKMGFKVIDSSTNFVFIEPPEIISAEKLFLKLKEEGILVRYFNQPRIDNYLRVSIGRREEMDVFLKNVKKLLEDN